MIPCKSTSLPRQSAAPLRVAPSPAVVRAVHPSPDSTPTPSPAEWTPEWTVCPSPAGYYINSVAISGNGSRVLAGTFFHNYSSEAPKSSAIPDVGDASQTGTFGTYCYDQTGSLCWKDEFTAWQGVYWVDVSTDGAWAAAGGWFSQSPYAGFVRAYDASTGTVLLQHATTARVNQVCLSADGSWLVSAANTLVLFQRVNGVFVKADEYVPAAADTFETISLSADGRTLVAGAYSGKVHLFSLANGCFGAPATWSLPNGGYSHSVRITPDGSSFAVGGSAGSFYLCDTATFPSSPQPTVSYQIPHAGSIYGVAISDDGRTFVGIANAAGGTGQVYCVDRSGSDGALRWTFATAHNPNSVCYNSTGGLVAIADGHPDGAPGGFYLLDASTGSQRGAFGTDNMSWPILISRDGTAVAAGSDNSNVYYFET